MKTLIKTVFCAVLSAAASHVAAAPVTIVAEGKIDSLGGVNAFDSINFGLGAAWRQTITIDPDTAVADPSFDDTIEYAGISSTLTINGLSVTATLSTNVIRLGNDVSVSGQPVEDYFSILGRYGTSSSAVRLFGNERTNLLAGNTVQDAIDAVNAGNYPVNPLRFGFGASGGDTSIFGTCGGSITNICRAWGTVDSVQIATPAVPLPAPIFFLAGGLLGLAFLRRSAKRVAAQT